MLIRDFQSGRLELEIKRADFPPEQLFDFAERRNPKRAFLFVSKVLGRHIPAKPSTMRKMWRELASRVPRVADMPVLFVGMAETALALGAGVFREYGAPGLFLADTRHDFARVKLAEFSENHSHAKKHYLYRPANFDLAARAVHLVLVDDELTTGDTFRNLLDALAGLNIGKVTKVVLLNWSGEDDVVSLLAGSWRWEWLDQPSALPESGYQAPEIAPISPRQDWGRFGAASVKIDPWPHIRAERGSRVLVLGTGEFVWPPFLLAERLEKAGAQTFFGATTRSPIKNGMAIGEKIEFADNYGLGLANYLYNVSPDDYDKIYLCTETDKKFISPDLLAYLKKAVVLEY